MKRLLFLIIPALLLFSSCTENYSNGNMVGTITGFKKSGVIWKSYEGHLNVTQTGMNTAHGFDFSIDNDREDPAIVAVLDSANNLGWKVEVTYHETAGKNWLGNRGHTNYFVTAVKVEDRNFGATGLGNSLFTGGGTRPGVTNVKNDTIVQINVTLDEARKAGWIK